MGMKAVQCSLRNTAIRCQRNITPQMFVRKINILVKTIIPGPSISYCYIN
uniref:Uncharacterized protein n=1 Tax=Arundo donax TaxID=35708 RepID=A0A0A8YNE0_ARUDO